MDPNELLRRLRAGEYTDAEEFAQMFADLDTWLTSGGFLPDSWRLAAERNRIIRPFDVLLCEECDTDREVATISGTTGVVRFRVCGHVQQ